MKDKLKDISVIIRCKNESDFIGFAIQSVLDFMYQPEIIIVDNNSTDDSMDVVRLFAYNNNISTINIDKYSPGKALNIGVESCNNNIILVLSAHCSINHIEGNISDDLTHNVAVFGCQKPIFKGKKINPQYVWTHFLEEPVINMWSDIEKRYFFHNAFCFYNRTFLLDHPFDEKWYSKEDRHWANDIIPQGHSILYNPEYKCYHFWTPNGATWKGFN